MRRKIIKSHDIKRKEFQEFGDYMERIRSLAILPTTPNSNSRGTSPISVSPDRRNSSMTKTPKLFERRYSHKSVMLTDIRNNEIGSPKDPKHKKFIQDESCKRMLRGSRAENFSILLSPFPKIDSVNHLTEVESELVLQEYENFKTFSESLLHLKKLYFDLDLTYQISRSDEKEKEKLPIGLYYQLEEELKKLFESNYKAIDHDKIENDFQSYTSFIREIIRGMKSKSCFDEAIVLEMF